jgi:hypothetical protein
MQHPRAIDLALFSGAIFLIVAIDHLLSHFLPINVYFSFRSFLLSEEGRYRYLALAIKLAIPFISGVLITYLLARRQTRDFDTRLRFYNNVKESYPLSLFAAGFFASLLQAWPLILYWEVFVDPRIFNYKVYFIIAYGCYFLSFGYLTLAGGLLCIIGLGRGKLDLYFPGQETFIKFGSVVRNGVLGFIASGLGTAIIEFLRTLGPSSPP